MHFVSYKRFQKLFLGKIRLLDQTFGHFQQKKGKKGLQIILPTNVINASLRLFVFVSEGINAEVEQSDHQEEELQCSLVNCLRWSAVKNILTHPFY